MVEMGHAAPLPDWIGYLIAAENANAKPWEFQADPDLPTKEWWLHKILIWNEARALAREWRQAEQDAKARANALRGQPRRR